jgi:hypothetical protein
MKQIDLLEDGRKFFDGGGFGNGRAPLLLCDNSPYDWPIPKLRGIESIVDGTAVWTGLPL